MSVHYIAVNGRINFKNFLKEKTNLKATLFQNQKQRQTAKQKIKRY